MDFPLFDFILASLLMGLGIGFDVALATVSRAQQLNTFRLAFIWVLGVSLTHTLFPMIGYLLAYFSVQVQPAIAPVIGVIAFTCIFFYLKAEFKQIANPEQENNNSQLLVTLGLILAVSWDALWSGPAKSAQVIGWPELMVWVSFLIVGAMVSLLAIGSLKFSHYIEGLNQKNAYMNWVGCWIQYSVIGYFGLLALLRYTLQVNMSWWQILLMSMLLIAGSLWFCIYSRDNYSRDKKGYVAKLS